MSSTQGLHGDTRRFAIRAAGRDEVTVSVGGQVLTVDASEVQRLLDEALEDCAAYASRPVTNSIVGPASGTIVQAGNIDGPVTL